MTARAILITGGLGGIGMAVATAFAHEGACILLVDREEDGGAACERLKQAGATDAVSLSGDVAREECVNAAVDLVFKAFGRFDVLVNVAGMMIYKPLAELEAAEWRRLLDVNLVSAALFTGQALRRMNEGGCVINIASVHARRTSPNVAPYAAAKAGMVSLTRSAAIEGKARNIRVNAILPGAVDTQMLRDSPNIKSGAEILDPGDVGQPQDIGALAAFLASDQARFITGEDIVADGGRMGKL